jgi:hypothetical protein
MRAKKEAEVPPVPADLPVPRSAAADTAAPVLRRAEGPAAAATVPIPVRKPKKQ